MLAPSEIQRADDLVGIAMPIVPLSWALTGTARASRPSASAASAVLNVFTEVAPCVEWLDDQIGWKRGGGKRGGGSIGETPIGPPEERRGLTRCASWCSYILLSRCPDLSPFVLAYFGLQDSYSFSSVLAAREFLGGNFHRE